MSAERLKSYLAEYGVIGCNESRSLTALSDIGCTWADATALIDTHEIFYSKALRSRTAYFSPRAYHLVKAARGTPVWTEQERALLSLMDGMPPLERVKIYRFSAMPKKDFELTFASLSKKLAVTALFNGAVLNENWSTLRYGTARAWEALASPPEPIAGDPREAAIALLGRALTEKDLGNLLGAVI